MDAVRRRLIKGDKNKGDKNTTWLINSTDEVMEIREFRGIFTGENNFFSKITVKASEQTDIDATQYGGDDSQGGQPSYLMIFCGGSLLRSSEGDLLLLRGEEFINFKTVFRDIVLDLDHDNGWSVQHCKNGSVKLTSKDGMTMTLDPSKLFAAVVDPVETLLLGTVLKFWPRIFADLYDNDKLGSTVCIVNDLMRQAKLYCVDQSKVEAAKVVGKVRDLNDLCATKVEWYRPLFPGMEDRFPLVAETMAEVDQEKLKRFAATIEPLLRQPNSLNGRSS
ncbi:hypothetical protein RHGRI_005435 [Rhododendron griersonianum]|uniref:Uncharacterized protein n=1 Tax=Rhododendron griersonianum TaxID=479676 RepID=A0AAV6LET0_9ERIC|nr:hypothetical protein RHGRI_005435 [Rhododendron griersonianum]